MKFGPRAGKRQITSEIDYLKAGSGKNSLFFGREAHPGVSRYDLPSSPDERARLNQTYPAKIRATSLEQVQTTARKYFTTGDLDIVLVGNVSAFRDALKKEFAGAEITEIPFGQVDVLSPTLQAAKQAAASIVAPVAAPEALEQGKQILLAAAQAAGGDALRSVATLGFSENGTLHNPRGDRQLGVTWQVSYPDRSYGEVSLGPTMIVQVCDGTSSWLKFPDGIRDTTDMISEFKRGITLFGGGWGLYQQALAGKITGQAIGEEEIGGKQMLGVAVNGAFGAVKLYFDPATHLLAAARYQSATDHGPSDNEQHWSNYHDVEGRQFAFATDTYRDGAKLFESTVQTVRINPKLDDVLFAKPAASAPARRELRLHPRHLLPLPRRNDSAPLTSPSRSLCRYFCVRGYSYERTPRRRAETISRSRV